MEHNEIGLLAALLAGFLSFISPCVLPLVPAYLSFMSGVSLGDIKSARGDRQALGRIMATSLAFVIGFSVVFVALGASASVLGQALHDALPVILKVAGALVIILGLHMTGVFRIRALAMERRFQAGGGAGLLAAFVMGLAFAFGWTPCIGPILAGILALAAQQETIGRGVLLLSCYSAGLGIPFLLAGLFINVFYSFFGRMQKHFHKVEIVSGIILIAVGILLLTDQLTRLSALFNQWFPSFEVG